MGPATVTPAGPVLASSQDGVLPASSHFAYLPVGLFAAVMGLTGLSVAWQQAEGLLGLEGWTSASIALLAAVSFLVLAGAYAAKGITAPAVVAAEFANPVTGNLFGTILISLLLLPIVMAPFGQSAARTMWVFGAVGMMLFAWLMVDRWMSDRQRIDHATPAWIVPVVGLLDVPLAIPALHIDHLHGLAVACLAIGLFFAVPLFTIIFSRLLFGEPLAPALQPMLLILVAPFAVGFSAYVTTTGRVDLFADALYSIMLFMLAVLVGRLRHLVRCCPFKVSWWSVSFPLAASAGAAQRYAENTSGIAPAVIAYALLAFASLVISVLLVRTGCGILRGELRALSQ